MSASLRLQKIKDKNTTSAKGYPHYTITTHFRRGEPIVEQFMIDELNISPLVLKHGLKRFLRFYKHNEKHQFFVQYSRTDDHCYNITDSFDWNHVLESGVIDLQQAKGTYKDPKYETITEYTRHYPGSPTYDGAYPPISN